MYKRIFFCLILFISVGEVMLRIDNNIESDRIIKVPLGLRETPEYNMLKENRIDLTGNNLRILVIGDSYIAGGGIDYKKRFSQQINLILHKNISKYDDVFVLDVSQSDANTLDNNLTYFQYVDYFKPHFVILGYNYNDVEGKLEKKSSEIEVGEVRTTNSYVNRNLTRKIYDLLKLSAFLRFASSKIELELKARGIIIPYSIFDVRMKSYSEDKEKWRKSKLLFQEVISDAEKKNIKLIVLKFPEIYLLDHNELFEQTDRVIYDFFNRSSAVIYIDGSKIFKGANINDLILSKYDGHPNEKAHKIFAIEVSHYIMNSDSSFEPF